MQGMLTGSGNFLVNGEVEGECNVDGTVTLARGGYWNGVIRAAAVIVAGTIDGDIISEGQVEISDSAKISGTVSGSAIAVAEGAVVEGVMQTTSKTEPHQFVEKREPGDASD